MKLHILIAAAASAAFLSPLAANAADDNAGMVNPPMAASPSDAAQPAAAPVAAPSAAATDSTVATVSNGPVPDTADNRAKYRPLSSAGRHTKAADN